MEEQMITALMIVPGEHPAETKLCRCRQFLELAVSFGAMYPCEVSFMPLSDVVGILYNREAPLLGLRGNRKIGSRILAGVFYIIGVEDGKPVSLTNDLIGHYTEQFWDPEVYSEKEVDQAFWDNWLAEIDQLLEL